MGCFTQEKVEIILADYGFSIKQYVVLPEFRRRVPSAYIPIFRQVLRQEIDLEIIGFLGGNQVRTMFPEKLYHAFLSMLPCIGPIVSKTKAEIKG
jgi:hypothetical protein